MHAGGRGRRRDRHPRPPGAPSAGSTSSSAPPTRTPASSSTTRSGSSTSATARSSTSTALKADWGIRPDQVVDLLALTGDAVDNVPGVPGIGLKTAVDAAPGVRHARQPPGQHRQGLGRQAQGEPRGHTARPSRRPAARHASTTTCPLDLDWDALGPTAPRRQGPEGPLHRVRLPRLPRRDRRRRAGAARSAVGLRLHDRRHARGPRRRSSRELEAPAQVLPRHRDDRPRPAPGRPRRALVLLGGGRGVLPPGPRADLGQDARPEATVLDALRPALTNPATEKVGQNLKYDMLVLRRAGIEIGGPVTDTMVLSYLLEAGERNHSLDQLSQRLLDHTMIPITDLIGKGKNQVTMDQVEVAKVARLRRRGRRRHLADRGDPRPPGPRGRALGPLRRPRTPPDPRSSPRWRRSGIKVDVARLQAALDRVRRQAGGDRGRDLQGGRATRSTSARSRSSGRSSSTS